MFTSEFLVFSLVFIVLNFFTDIFSKKVIHIDGTDFLFFAPWLAGIKYGIPEGVLLAGILLVIHSMMHLRLARFILLALPAQALAVLFGYWFGIGGFWVALVVYSFASTVTTAFLGGLGYRYFLFLLTNIITNVTAFFVYMFLF